MPVWTQSGHQEDLREKQKEKREGDQLTLLAPKCSLSPKVYRRGRANISSATLFGGEQAVNSVAQLRYVINMVSGIDLESHFCH